MAKSTIRHNAVIYRELEDAILDGRYQPGDWLPIDELSARFQVSRQPVMEAMRRLSSDFLVEIVPQVGCRVASYNKQSIIDYLATFGELEGRMAELAAWRRTDAQLAQLDLLINSVEWNSAPSSEYLKLSRDYHRIVMDMAHSRILERICEQLWLLGSFGTVSLASAEMRTSWAARSRQALQRLTRAIRNKESYLARRLMLGWLTESVSDVLDSGRTPTALTKRDLP